MKPFWLSRAHSVAVPVGLSVALLVFSSSPPQAVNPSRATAAVSVAATNLIVLSMTASLFRWGRWLQSVGIQTRMAPGPRFAQA